MRVKIDGITYEATPIVDGPHHVMVKIGKRGKPIAQHRPGTLLRDGTWKLLAWFR